MDVLFPGIKRVEYPTDEDETTRIINNVLGDYHALRPLILSDQSNDLIGISTDLERQKAKINQILNEVRNLTEEPLISSLEDDDDDDESDGDDLDSVSESSNSATSTTHPNKGTNNNIGCLNNNNNSISDIKQTTITNANKNNNNNSNGSDSDSESSSSSSNNSDSESDTSNDSESDSDSEDGSDPVDVKEPSWNLEQFMVAKAPTPVPSSTAPAASNAAALSATESTPSPVTPSPPAPVPPVADVKPIPTAVVAPSLSSIPSVSSAPTPPTAEHKHKIKVEPSPVVPSVTRKSPSPISVPDKKPNVGVLVADIAPTILSQSSSQPLTTTGSTALASTATPSPPASGPLMVSFDISKLKRVPGQQLPSQPQQQQHQPQPQPPTQQPQHHYQPQQVHAPQLQPQSQPSHPPPPSQQLQQPHHHQQPVSPAERSHLALAKSLKHAADKEKDRTVQASKYLESVLHFISFGIGLEPSQALQIYTDTSNMLRHLTRTTLIEPKDFQPTDLKLITLTLRCQSLLNWKIFKLRSREFKDNKHMLQKMYQDHDVRCQLDSCNSSSSASSSTATDANHSITLKFPFFNALSRQVAIYDKLGVANDSWVSADANCEKYPAVRAFFSTLDSHCGVLTTSTGLPKLVEYVRCGLDILTTKPVVSLSQ